MSEHVVALLIAVDFDFNKFSDALDGEDELVYGTAMRLFAQRWKETGSPTEGLGPLIFQWQVITA